jgi:hypothetical protein
LAGDRDRAAEEARAAYPLALDKRHLWFAGELAYPNAGRPPRDVAGVDRRAVAFQLEGAAEDAAAAWNAKGCRYEAGRALGEAKGQQPLRDA